MLMNVSLQTALKCVPTLRVPTSVAVRKDSVYFLTIQHVKVDLHIKNKTFDLYVPLCWSFTHADIDECESSEHHCEQTCINQPGSYTCNCTLGFTLLSNGYSCQGIHILIQCMHLQSDIALRLTLQLDIELMKLVQCCTCTCIYTCLG